MSPSSVFILGYIQQAHQYLTLTLRARIFEAAFRGSTDNNYLASRGFGFRTVCGEKAEHVNKKKNRRAGDAFGAKSCDGSCVSRELGSMDPSCPKQTFGTSAGCISRSRRFPMCVARNDFHQGHDTTCILKFGPKAIWNSTRLIAGVVLTNRR